MKKKIVVFGLVGPIASGIWVVTDLLKENDYTYIRLSDRIREEGDKRGLENTRQVWQKLGDELRAEKGADTFAKQTAKIVLASGEDKVIIDSIRNPEELLYIKKKFSALIIGVDAPVDIRYQLMLKRKRGVDPLDFIEFKRLDEYEQTNGGKQSRQDIQATLKGVDLLFTHQGDLDSLKKEVEKALTVRSLN